MLRFSYIREAFCCNTESFPTSCIFCRTGEMVSFFVFSRKDSTAFPTPPSMPRTEPCLLRITDMAAVRDHADLSRGRRRMNGFRKAELSYIVVYFFPTSVRQPRPLSQQIRLFVSQPRLESLASGLRDYQIISWDKYTRVHGHNINCSVVLL